MNKKSLGFKTNSFLFLVVSVFFLVPEFVIADAWFGYGVRDKDWILKRGGSIIRYEILDAESSEKYLVQMYLLGSKGAGGGNKTKAKAGDLIEWETKSKTFFDDAINNEYRIKFYVNGEFRVSKDVVARPGEIIKLKANLKKKTVSKKTEVAYTKDKIKLNSESSKYIDPVELDILKPFFIVHLPEKMTVAEGERINFKAMDRETKVKHYQIRILNKGGKAVLDWRRQVEEHFFIPNRIGKGFYRIFVRAYDQAGNFAEEEAELKIVEEKDLVEEKLEPFLTNSDGRENVLEKEDGEKKEKEEIAEIENSFIKNKKEIESLEKEIEQETDMLGKRNGFLVFFMCSDRKIIEVIEANMEIMRGKIFEMGALEEDAPDDLKDSIKNKRSEFESILANKKIILDKSRAKIGFFAKLVSLFGK